MLPFFSVTDFSISKILIIRAIQVSAGRQHFAALLENGDVVLFGSNHAGQLGARPHYRNNGHHVIHTKSLFGSLATKVSCGMDHTVLLLNDGRVVTFGLGCDGQLGLGRAQILILPIFSKEAFFWNFLYKNGLGRI